MTDRHSTIDENMSHLEHVRAVLAGAAEAPKTHPDEAGPEVVETRPLDFTGTDRQETW